jgi:hypothetical protein
MTRSGRSNASPANQPTSRADALANGEMGPHHRDRDPEQVSFDVRDVRGRSAKVRLFIESLTTYRS